MPFADWNFDGTVDLSDQSAYTSDKNADTGLGRGDPGYAWSETGGALRKAYAGYEIYPVLTGAEGWESLYHVRHRVYLSTLGRWTRRDPLGYVDGMSSYGYVLSAPIHFTDPLGTHSRQPSDLDCDNPCRPPCDHEWGPLAILQSSDSCTECTSYKRTVGVFKGRNYRLSDDRLSTTRYNTVGIFLQGTADNTGAKGYANSVFYHTAVINFVESVSYLGSVNSPFKFLVACTPDYVPVVQEMSGIPPSSGWLELAPGDYPIYGRVRFSWKAHRSEESPCVTVEVKISANMKHYNRGRTWFAWPPSQWNDDNVFRLGVDKYKGHAGGSVSVSWTWCCDGCMLL
jgi:RHS repeat-associated protein